MSPLQVEIPASYEPERRYAITTLLDDFLGIPTQISVSTAAPATTIRAGDHRSLVLPDALFALPDGEWLTPGSVPELVSLDTAVGPLATLPGLPAPVLVEHDDSFVLNVDVLGLAFFMLTRYEEVARPAEDAHGRFPLTASVTREFLDRPLVDEHVELLWSCLLRLWPQLERLARTFSVFATHDVDHAFAYPSCSLSGMAGLAARSVLRQRDLRGAAAIAADWSAVQRGHLERDPFNTYDLIMQTCEDTGADCAFYVIPDEHPLGRDPRHLYRPEDAPVLDVLRRVQRRGHEIGVHPSYPSHLSPQQLRDEVDRLRDALRTADIGADVTGGRQHYLRWSASVTWWMWDELGLDYDSSVGYAEAPGFRAGVCHSFPTFDLERRRPMRLRERPLLVMERTLEDYLKLDLDGDAVRSAVDGLKETTRRHGGEFVVLWHNSSLGDPRHVELYRAALSR